MSFFVQILCTDSLDSKPCVVIGTDSYRVIVNCGEGVQRLCVEHKVRLGKISTVLTTDSKPHTIFGLPGLALTLVDAGITALTLCGPGGLLSLFKASRYFMKLPDGLLGFKELGKSSDVTNAVVVHNNELTIKSIPLLASQQFGDNEPIVACYLGSTPTLLGKFDIKKAQELKVPKGEMYGKLKRGECVVLEDGTEVRPEQVLGEAQSPKHFLVVANIPVGDTEMLEQLIDNCEVNKCNAFSSGSGTMSCMVHLSSAEMINCPQYCRWMHSFGTQVTHILCGEGCGPNHISQSAFLSTTIQCNKMHFPVPEFFPRLHTSYRRIKHNGAVDFAQLHCNVVGGIPGMRYSFLPARTQGLSYTLNNNYDNDNNDRSNAGDDGIVSAADDGACSRCICDRQAELLWEAALVGESSACIEAAQHNLKELRTASFLQTHSTSGQKHGSDTDIANHTLHSIYGIDSEPAALLAHCESCLSFLGTGCAVPSKYRNVSGILLDLPNSPLNGEPNALLIDAGEGTWAQMLRLTYELWCRNSNGNSNSKMASERICTEEITHRSESSDSISTAELGQMIARKLHVVWISHPHADHHLGLVRIIAERKASLTLSSVTFSPLIVIAPASVLSFLREYSETAHGSYLCDAYLGVSCREFDPDDDCHHTDSYWKNMLVNDSNIVERKEETDEIKIGKKHNKLYHDDDHNEGGMNMIARENKKQKIESNANAKSDSFCTLGSGGVGGSLTDQKGWKNYQSVFKEEHGASLLRLRQKAYDTASAALKRCGIEKLQNVQVIHCGQSYGLSIEIASSHTPTCSSPKKSIKLVYSGDTRPCERLVELGKDATILIHEATFDNDKAIEAVNKRHSTLGEAMEVGRKMGTFRSVFTHFSQRYPGVPQMEDIVKHSGDQNYGSDCADGIMSRSKKAVAPVIAFDFMQLPLRDLIWAPTVTPLLAAAYPIGSSNTLNSAVEDEL